MGRISGGILRNAPVLVQRGMALGHEGGLLGKLPVHDACGVHSWGSIERSKRDVAFGVHGSTSSTQLRKRSSSVSTGFSGAFQVFAPRTISRRPLRSYDAGGDAYSCSRTARKFPLMCWHARCQISRQRVSLCAVLSIPQLIISTYYRHIPRVHYL